MKKAVQTKVLWQFSLAPMDPRNDQRIFISSGKGNKDCVLDKILISSLLGKHSAGRCVHVVVEGMREGGEGIGSHYFLDTTSGRFEGIVGPDGYAYGFFWKLLDNEEFLDGALRIGQSIMKKLDAVGLRKNFRYSWMFGNFTVTQQTYVSPKDPNFHGTLTGKWQPIEDYLRYCRGWR